MRLVQLDLERSKVGVPLDQRGDGTEAPERRGIELQTGFATRAQAECSVVGRLEGSHI